MKLPAPKRLAAMITAGLIVLATAVTAALLHSSGAVSNPAPVSHKQSTQPASAHTTTPSPTGQTSTDAAQKPSASKDPGGVNEAKPTNSACKLLTQAVAQQAIGADAKTSSPSDTASLATADTTLVACAYASGSSTVQLAVRTPKNSLGTSKNATVFGSEKPSNAVTLQGYGQAAYWDPATQRLNILNSNNWYIITVQPSTQATAETIAKQIVAAF